MKALRTGTPRRPKALPGAARTAFALLAIALTTPAGLGAKCALASYSFTGQVQAPDGSAIEGARVLLFLDGAAPGDAHRPSDRAEAGGETDARGRFEIGVFFDPFSRRLSFLGDRCRRRPRRADLVVRAAGFRPQRVRFSRRQLPLGFDRGTTVRLPAPVVLERVVVEDGLQLSAPDAGDRRMRPGWPG